MNIPNNDQDKSQQARLRTLIILTVGLGILLRLLAPGWLLAIFGILLLIIIVIHVIIQMIAIKHIPHAKPRYSNLLMLSNLLFFIGFTFQFDFDDNTGVLLPILLPVISGARIDEGLGSILIFIVDIGAFLLLFLSWILLLTLRKKLTKNDELS